MAFLKCYYYRYYIYIYVFLCSVTVALSWTPINENVVMTPTTQMENEARNFNEQKTTYKNNEVSPYIDLVLCPLHVEPWTCARQQSARLLDIWNGDLYAQWQKLKVEADRELNVTLEKRGYSDSETISSKEKPSSILKKIEIGTNYMKDYLSKTMDGFLGNELEPMAKTEEQETEEDEEEEEDEEQEEEDQDEAADITVSPTVAVNSKNDIVAASSTDTEFIELSSSEKSGKKKGQGQRKRKKNKKGQGNAGVQPATVVLLQQPVAPVVHHVQEEHEYEEHDHGGAGTEVVHVYHEEEEDAHQGHGHNKPNKLKQRKQKRQKKRKNKRKQQHGTDLLEADDDALSTVLGQHPTGGLGLGLLEDLIGSDDWLVDGGKRKKGQATNYGRSIGVMRGKKKKKKKALMKLVLLGSFLKAKIELLLKILGAHLQIKFFAIALIGLLINIARFWIDVKRGGAPQKVVYVEHAHHQHHYEDHGEEWSEPGGYWKRSLPADSITDENSVTDSYMPQDDAHYLAYRNQWTK